MEISNKKVLLVLLAIAFLATYTSPVFADGEEHRFYITAEHPDWGRQTFWFRCSDSFSVNYDTGETVTFNHYVLGWKQPVDNIFPPPVGNGSMTYIKAQLVDNSNGSVVDETNINGNYELIYPSDWIYYYWWRSANSSQMLSGSKMGGYTVRDKITAVPPLDWIIKYNGYSDPTYSL